MERLIGPVAYRGRLSYIEKKSGKNLRHTGIIPGQPKPAHTLDLGSRGIPMNTRKSERRSQIPQNRPNVTVRDRKKLKRPGSSNRRPPK